MSEPTPDGDGGFADEQTVGKTKGTGPFMALYGPVPILFGTVDAICCFVTVEQVNCWFARMSRDGPRIVRERHVE